MKIYQVDMRKGNTNYAYLTLYLLSKSYIKPSHSQIQTCLKLYEKDENLYQDLHVFGIDDSLEINDYDFGIEQINEINDKIIDSLKSEDVICIIDPFDATPSLNNILNEDEKIIIVSRDGHLNLFNLSV